MLSKALAKGLRPIVAINKIDKSDERHLEVLDEVFDSSWRSTPPPNSSTSPCSNGSAKQGWMAEDPSGPKETLAPCSTR